jgi:predicted TIM-barrel fold metal-dependent hydrolase
MPAFVDFGIAHWSSESTDWRNLFELCERFPRLPFVVVGEGMGAPRRLFPTWADHPNLHLETSYYQVNQGLSEIADRFGAERLIFGTGLPYRAPGPPLTQLRHDFLSCEDRAKVGGDNLRKLLGLPASDEFDLCDRSDSDLLPPCPVIDAHAHLGRWFSTYIHAGDAASMVRSMDRLGIESTAIIAFDAIAADYKGGNDQVRAAMNDFPGRFLGYATVDPNDWRGMTAELERCFGQLGFHAIKFHCDTHGCPADSDRYQPALEYANAHRKAVLIHGRITEAMLRSYPNAQFLSAHVGAWDGAAPHYAIELCRDYPNLHCELCSSVVHTGALERLVELVGADRVVHGSDTPLMDAGYQLGRVTTARLGDDDKRLILRDNARRLFGLAGRA